MIDLTIFLSLSKSSLLAREFCIHSLCPNALRVLTSPFGAFPRISSAIDLLKAMKRAVPGACRRASTRVVVLPDPATAWMMMFEDMSWRASKTASWRGDHTREGAVDMVPPSSRESKRWSYEFTEITIILAYCL